MSDGSIFIYTGFIDKIDSLDELGFVVSHELAHVLFRHSAEKMSAGAVITILLMFLQIYLDADLGFGRITKLVANLPLSEYAETEADGFAVKIMSEVGLDSKAALSLMEKMKNWATVEFLLAHPLSQHRAYDIKKEILNATQKNDYENQEILKLRRKFIKARNIIVNTHKNSL